MSHTQMTQGAHHIELTVPNVAQSRDFFVGTLGYQQIGEVPEYPAVFVSDGTTMITLWQAENPETATRFDRKNGIGLHHLALAVTDSGALDDLHHKLSSAGDVEVEFAPEPLGDGPTKHMMCAIPGGIRVEFIAPAG